MTPYRCPVLGNDSDPEGLLDVTSVTIVDLAPIHGMTWSIRRWYHYVRTKPGLRRRRFVPYRVADNAGSPSGIATIRIHVFRETQSSLVADDDGVRRRLRPRSSSTFWPTTQTPMARSTSQGPARPRWRPTTTARHIDPVTGQITFTPDPDFFGIDNGSSTRCWTMTWRVRMSLR